MLLFRATSSYRPAYSLTTPLYFPLLLYRGSLATSSPPFKHRLPARIALSKSFLSRRHLHPLFPLFLAIILDHHCSPSRWSQELVDSSRSFSLTSPPLSFSLSGSDFHLTLRPLVPREPWWASTVPRLPLSKPKSDLWLISFALIRIGLIFPSFSSLSVLSASYPSFEPSSHQCLSQVSFTCLGSIRSLLDSLIIHSGDISTHIGAKYSLFGEFHSIS